MKKIKFKELILLILIALLFFIIGNMFQHSIFSNLKDLLLNSKTYNNDYKASYTSLTSDNSEFEEVSKLSLNKLRLKNSNEPLKILVAGHVYGNPYEVDNFHPAMTLQTNIQLFNQMSLDMIVFLGDIIHKPTEENLTYLHQNFLQYFTVPVFNAVGNHDVQNRPLYMEVFGETNFSFL